MAWQLPGREQSEEVLSSGFTNICLVDVRYQQDRCMGTADIFQVSKKMKSSKPHESGHLDSGVRQQWGWGATAKPIFWHEIAG